MEAETTPQPQLDKDRELGSALQKKDVNIDLLEVYARKEKDKERDEEPEQAEQAEEQETNEINQGGIMGKLKKQDYQVIKENGTNNWPAEELQVKYCIELFINSKVTESEMILAKKYGKTLLHTHGAGVLSMLKALMTFDQNDITYAMESLRNTTEAASYLRKNQNLISSFSGMLFGGAQKNRQERQIEICHAEGYLLKACLSVLTDSNFTTFIKEGLAIRQSYNTYKACYKFLAKTYAQGGHEALVKHKVDSVFVTGVYLGVGGFNLMLSMIPAKILRLFEFIGFSGQRDFGMQCLAYGGDWNLNLLLHENVQQHSSTRTSSRSSTSKTPKTCINFFCPAIPVETGCGTRKFMCEILLHLYHVVISTMIPMPGVNFPLATRMADAGLAAHPDSFLFLIVRGKISQAERNLDRAIGELNRVVEVSKDWRQLAHLCFWDLGIDHAAKGEYVKAAEYFDILFNENEWSKSIYLYFKAVLLYEANPTENKEKVTEMMKLIPNYLKRVAGKSIPLEKFVARKARKYLLQDSHLVFPVLEFLYMWNGVDLIPAWRLDLISAEIDLELSRLDTLQTENGETVPYANFHDDYCLVRFFKGLVAREIIAPTSALLVPEKDLILRARGVSQDEREKLGYAARQLEYITLQADDLTMDHWILPFARYELAAIRMRTLDYKGARGEYEAALNGGYGDMEAGHKKVKASMESSLHIKVHNALERLAMMEFLSEGAAAGVAPFTIKEEEDDSDDDE